MIFAPLCGTHSRTDITFKIISFFNFSDNRILAFFVIPSFFHSKRSAKALLLTENPLTRLEQLPHLLPICLIIHLSIPLLHGNQPKSQQLIHMVGNGRGRQ